MRIGVDMLGIQSAGRTRGVGRFTRRLVSELIARRPQSEFVLYFYAGHPGADEAFPGAACVKAMPRDDAQGGLYRTARRLADQNFDRLDALLLTNPLENFCGYQPPLPPASGLRMGAIVYDLIPAIFPEQYLQHPGIARAYGQALDALSRYDLLLTISEAGRRDWLRLIGGAPERVANIGAASDPAQFTLRTSRNASADTRQLLERHGISAPFIFSLTALDHRKNLRGVLAAYELLPRILQESHQLVLTCAMSSKDDYARVSSLVAQSPIARRVILTGPLDDDELRLLYQHCAVFLFPSRYEGFGLPILEAMQCGAPVVAGRNSSQIEVVGGAGLLADIDRPEEVTASLQKVLEDATFSQSLRLAGPRQARQFSWEKTAELCIAAIERTVAAPPAAGRLRRFLARGHRAVNHRLAWRRTLKRCA